jgi:preprotein translocase subunit YajC
VLYLFLGIVVIGIGTMIGLLKEQSNQNKKIIKLLEKIVEDK